MSFKQTYTLERTLSNQINPLNTYAPSNFAVFANRFILSICPHRRAIGGRSTDIRRTTHHLPSTQHHNARPADVAGHRQPLPALIQLDKPFTEKQFAIAYYCTKFELDDLNVGALELCILNPTAKAPTNKYINDVNGDNAKHTHLLGKLINW